MSAPFLTVQQAITRGTRVIERPAIIILASGPVLCVLLMVLNFSWWYLLLLPAGLLLSFLYTIIVTPRWRIWAYEHVNDIQQFERSAELEGLFGKQSVESIGSFLSIRQQEKLKALQASFLSDPVFIDDPSIPAETTIYTSAIIPAFKKPVMVINEAGIKLDLDEIIEWSQIENDHVASVSYVRTSRTTGGDIPGGTEDFFRFAYPGGRFEIPLSSINIPAWKLDLLLYTYRGRYAKTRHQ